MRDFALRVTAVIALAAGAALAAERVEAAPVIPGGIAAANEHLSLTDKVQFIYEGRPYCWYRYGWAGPGWYWCGYGTRFGFGWGGAYGWNGWVAPRSSRPLRVAPYRFRRYR